MRSFPAAVLVTIAIALPQLATVGHADDRIGPGAGDRQLVFTGHDEPEPAPHLEARFGTLDLHCLGCLLDRRDPGPASAHGPVARPQSAQPVSPKAASREPGRELTASSSPRAPPLAAP